MGLEMTDLSFIVFLIVSAYQDFRKRKLSNRLCLAGFLCAIVIGGWDSGWISCLESVGSALGIIFLTVWIWMLGAISAGDVKWFGAAGSFIGWMDAAYVFMGAVLFAGCYALMLLCVSTVFRRKVQRVVMEILVEISAFSFDSIPSVRRTAQAGKRFPFMAAVTPSAIVFYLLSGGVL